jgi:hypothetical protein
MVGSALVCEGYIVKPDFFKNPKYPPSNGVELNTTLQKLK